MNRAVGIHANHRQVSTIAANREGLTRGQVVRVIQVEGSTRIQEDWPSAKRICGTSTDDSSLDIGSTAIRVVGAEDMEMSTATFYQCPTGNIVVDKPRR